MADNVAISAGGSTTIAADEITDATLGTVKVQYVKICDGTLDGTAKAAVGTGGLQVEVRNRGFDVQTTVTRGNNSTTYSVNDSFATSLTTTGGYTLANVARAADRHFLITDAVITSSVELSATRSAGMQGEVLLFNQSVSWAADNAELLVTDTQVQTYLGKIPFAMEDFGDNQAAHITGLNIAGICVGTADLRFLVKMKNSYIPDNAEVLSVRVKGYQTD